MAKHSTTNKKGYVLVYAPDHPMAQKRGWVLEHRKVWFDHYGELPDRLVIHHKNGVKSDNRIENLEPLTAASHALAHWGETGPILDACRHIGTAAMVSHIQAHGAWNKGQAEYTEVPCCVCGTIFRRLARDYRRNVKRGQSPCCSSACHAKKRADARHAAKARGEEATHV